MRYGYRRYRYSKRSVSSKTDDNEIADGTLGRRQPLRRRRHNRYPYAQTHSTALDDDDDDDTIYVCGTHVSHTRRV